MSDMILENDMHEARHMGWHRKTNINEDLTLENCWLDRWDVVGTPLFLPDGKPTEFKVFTCTDNPDIVVGQPFGPDYAPINNQRFLQLIRESVEGTDHIVESVGSVRNRGRIFVSMKLKGLEKFKAAGREFRPFLNFLSSHDKSNSLTVSTSNICVVCDNTFGFSLAETEREDSSNQFRARVPHRGDVESGLVDVAKAVDRAVGVHAEFAQAMDLWDERPIAERDAQRLVTGFVAAESKLDRLHARSANRINDIVELFLAGAGNRGKTLADLMSGITDYYSHSGARDAQRQFERSEFGAGARSKRRFYSLLKDGEEMEKTIKAGAALLALSN
jgi:Domain of unknown function (DUF932)